MGIYDDSFSRSQVSVKEKQEGCLLSLENIANFYLEKLPLFTSPESRCDPVSLFSFKTFKNLDPQISFGEDHLLIILLYSIF